MGHLGKGSYSDVFEVIVKDGKLVLGTSNNPNSARRRPSRARRATQEYSSSVTTATLARPTRCDHGSRRVLAMKCLRPQIRSDADQFTIGAEDLVHETAILANLDHPNIIKLHGRSPGKLTDAFVLNDGYFVLLDKLDETLQDRLDAWKQTPKCMLQGPTNGQVEVARTIAKAMTYLHSKNILFRDLKPDNVGFDANGVLKLFDFGFAVGLPEKDSKNPEGLLYDHCGTLRYMAPEVGLEYGYRLPADVYSFGVLLWEICALEKPFSYINSSNEFDRVVFMEHHRPAIDERWPVPLKEIMGRCWSPVPGERPTMPDVELALSAEMTRTDHAGSENVSPKRRVRKSGLMRTRRLSVTGW